MRFDTINKAVQSIKTTLINKKGNRNDVRFSRKNKCISSYKIGEFFL